MKGLTMKVTVDVEHTLFGDVWTVTDTRGAKHVFSSRDEAVRWAQRHRYNAAVGDIE